MAETAMDRVVQLASKYPVAAGIGGATVATALALGIGRYMRQRGRQVVTITVPATTANLACGFDAFGAALELFLQLRAEAAPRQPETRFTYEGLGSEEVALDESNLIWKSALTCQQMFAPERRMPKLAVHVKNSVPFGRGLGSSATAIIAGVVLAKEMLDLDLSKEQLLNAALEIENHPDNLSAALWGGATVSGVSEGGKSMVRNFQISSSIKAVVVIPDFQLSTQKSRDVLPPNYSRSDVVFNLQRVGLLPLVLSESPPNYMLIRECMKDKIHQNQRAPLVPGLEECLWLSHTLGNSNLLSTALSGAGPCILAMCVGDFDRIGSKMQDILRKNNVQSKYYILPFCKTGTTVTWSMF